MATHARCKGKNTREQEKPGEARIHSQRPSQTLYHNDKRDDTCVPTHAPSLTIRHSCANGKGNVIVESEEREIGS